jgi:hypothetical protein
MKDNDVTHIVLADVTVVHATRVGYHMCVGLGMTTNKTLGLAPWA